MYLHGFPQPRIHEYDTLTSEERWDERYDLIMANPPFMTPKGGVRPHNRFSIKAKRSEVLFVDYIAEHLNVNGRAGVIVPEGIIFQSQNSYKNLRKMLVENYLWCIINLPAGVFNPYSGVKTSILLMDKAQAKRRNEILFVKIENDGFDLGAQRRSIDGTDLPEALRLVDAWKAEGKLSQGKMAHAVLRKRILESVDISLSGERYRAVLVRGNGKVPKIKLSEVCCINPPKGELADLDGALEVSFVPMSELRESQPSFQAVDTKPLREVMKGYSYFRDGDVLLAKITPCFENGKAGIARGLNNGIGFGSTEFIVLRPDKKQLLPELLYYFIASEDFRIRGVAHMTGSAGQQRVASSFIQNHEVPLLPLAGQKALVAELEGYRKVIEGAKQIIANYRPRIPIQADWPDVIFSNAPLQIIDGDRGTNYPKKEDFAASGYCLFLNTKNVRENGFLFDKVSFISKKKDESLRQGKLKPRDVVLTTRGTVGNTGVFDSKVPFEHIRINSGMLIFRPDEAQLDSEYLFMFFQSENFKSQVQIILSGSAQPQLPIRNLQTLSIPIPDIDTQKAIVSGLESERALVDSNQKLIGIYEKKIQDKLADIWGEQENDFGLPNGISN